MALDTRVKKLEEALQGQQQEIMVILHDMDNPSPKEMKAARQKALEEGRQVIFIGELERWSR